MNKNTEILIVGAGAFGTSTAYHLAKRGYTSIRVLDRYESPSCEAASTDISKVIRSDYNVPLYAELGAEAIEAWKSWDVFRGLYHVPGWVLSAKDLSIPFVEGSIRTSARMKVSGVERLTHDQIRTRWPLVNGALEGWNINVWNSTAGWADAGEALCRMTMAAQELGVIFKSGDSGTVTKLISFASRCNGVQTQDGAQHEAGIIILAAGAWIPSLLDVEGQLTAKGHAVAHIQMTSEEKERYATMPIMDNLELGYFFPPQKDGIFKMAHSQFITNNVKDSSTRITTSVPHTFNVAPLDDLPLEIEATMRRNLRRVFPELADRPFCYTRLCWDADTPDRHFLIAPTPYAGLFIAGGGSAHGFKFLPVLGKYIGDMLEGTLNVDIAKQWRWRPGQKVSSKDLAHMDPELDLSELTGWRGGRMRREAVAVPRL